MSHTGTCIREQLARIEQIAHTYQHIDFEGDGWAEQLRNMEEAASNLSAADWEQAQILCLTNMANADVLGYIDQLAETAEDMAERGLADDNLDDIIAELNLARNTWCHHPQGYTPQSADYLLEVPPKHHHFFAPYGNAFEEHDKRTAWLDSIRHQLGTH